MKFNYQRRDSYAFFHFLSNNIKAKQPVADARMIVDFNKERFSFNLNFKFLTTYFITYDSNESCMTHTYSMRHAVQVTWEPILVYTAARKASFDRFFCILVWPMSRIHANIPIRKCSNGWCGFYQRNTFHRLYKL